MDGLKRCARLSQFCFMNLFRHDALARRYKADADIEMLGLILAGELREEVYTQQLHMLDLVLGACERAESDGLPAGTQLTGVLPWTKFEKTVRCALPLKRDDLFEKILESAREQQLNGNAVEKIGDVESIKYVYCLQSINLASDMMLLHRYRMLFEEDREFNQGPFAEALRDQYIEERNDWLADLQSTVHEILTAADPENAKLDSSSLDMLQLTAADFKRAILSFDNGKTEKEVDRYVCVCK